jgi:prepilin-type N-terminal cleavage/methylation domain-containing protein
MNWSFGSDLVVLRSQNGFLMIEVIISTMVISIVVMLLYHSMSIFQ